MTVESYLLYNNVVSLSGLFFREVRRERSRRDMGRGTILTVLSCFMYVFIVWQIEKF